MRISQFLYQDELHGSLIIMADRVIDLIYLKYLKASISYHKETRVETYPFAREAVREAVYNALIHCNWADNVPVQIRIEDEAMYISNSSMLPIGWNEDTLLGSHSSKPYNPDIAKVFYRAGYIESWGRGIQKICDACKMAGAEEPKYNVHGEDIMVKIHAVKSANAPIRQNGGLDGGLESKVLEIIKQNPNITQKELSDDMKISFRTMQRIIKALRENGKLDRVGGKRYGQWIVIE